MNPRHGMRHGKRSSFADIDPFDAWKGALDTWGCWLLHSTIAATLRTATETVLFLRAPAAHLRALSSSHHAFSSLQRAFICASSCSLLLMLSCINLAKSNARITTVGEEILHGTAAPCVHGPACVLNLKDMRGKKKSYSSWCAESFANS